MAGEPFFQGSFSYGTIIRPCSGNEFDVDVVYPFSVTAFNHYPFLNANGLLDWFTKHLKQDADYDQRLIRKPRCVRLDYAGDFHLDIVMSTSEYTNHQPYAVPTRDLMEWITNDPIGLKNWVARLNIQSGLSDKYGIQRFVRCVRMMKRWRDAVLPRTIAPSSILLLTILGKHEPAIKTYNPPLVEALFPSYSTDAAYLYDMGRLTHSCLKVSGSQAFIHPTIRGDNLASSWKPDDVSKFMLMLEDFLGNMKAGIEADTLPASIHYYKRAFGDSFPN